MKIVHFQRRPHANQHSIEGLFESYRGEMARLGANVVHEQLPFLSRGIINRIRNTLWARDNQASVNHITGDIHYIALGLIKRKTILTVHDVEILERSNGVKRWLVKLLWFDLPIRCVARLTVISDFTRQQLIRQCPFAAPKVEVIPNAVGGLFKPSPKKFNRELPVILQFGSKQNKNMARVAEALAGIPCHLIVVGEVTACRELKANKVSFEQRKNLTDQELLDVYGECDVVSFVSTYEGFGLPIIEAQMVERPVVTSDCSSMPEVAGKGACFVDPFDVHSIRSGFLRVINDAEFRAQLVREGRQNRARFELEHVASQYLDLYRRVFENPATVAAGSNTWKQG